MRYANIPVMPATRNRLRSIRKRMNLKSYDALIAMMIKWGKGR